MSGMHKLSIAGRVVVDNDGLYGTLERSGNVALARGSYNRNPDVL